MKTIRIKAKTADRDLLWLLLGMGIEEYEHRDLAAHIWTDKWIHCRDGVLLDGVPYVGDIEIGGKPETGLHLAQGEEETTDMTIAQCLAAAGEL